MHLFQQGRCSVLVSLSNKMVRFFKNTVGKAPKNSREFREEDYEMDEKENELAKCSANFLGNKAKTGSLAVKANLPGFYQLVYSLKR